MTERTAGAYSWLQHPSVYEAVQWAMGANRTRDWFASTCIRAKPGDRVLDIGCGPAALLDHLGDVEYVGYDPAPAYIEQARSRFGARGTFHLGYFTEADITAELFDIVIVSGVLHHMTDEEARSLFTHAAKVLKPGGRVVSLDNVYIDDQNPVARLIISLDRGRHVRRPEQYKALASGAFDHVTGDVINKTFPPYTYWTMTASSVAMPDRPVEKINPA